MHRSVWFGVAGGRTYGATASKIYKSAAEQVGVLEFGLWSIHLHIGGRAAKTDPSAARSPRRGAVPGTGRARQGALPGFARMLASISGPIRGRPIGLLLRVPLAAALDMPARSARPHC
jgi:hypothetical protein